MRTKRLHVVARNRDKTNDFAAKLLSLGVKLDIHISTAEEACRQADIVVTATPSRVPLFKSEWIRPGTHIAGMGSDALRAYQDATYAERFRSLLERIRNAEDKAAAGSTRLTEAVARNAFKLMAYKDEYEVARLPIDPSFWDGVQRRFEGGALRLHLAPPIFFGRDPASGRPRKRAFSARYLLPLLRFLARGKVLRGSALDPFGWMRERRMERMLRDRYLTMVDEIAARLDASNLEAAVTLASYPGEIRGYGPLKDESVHRAEARVGALRSLFDGVSRRDLNAA